MNDQQKPTDEPLDRLLTLLIHAEAPFHEDAVAMDCQDGCEDVAYLAEQVARGADINVIYPAYADHMNQIGCCKEEFQALVNVIKAELSAEDNDSPD